MLNGQLELSLKAEKTHLRRALRRTRSSAAANWWFERMRQIVDRAIEYPPAQAPRASFPPAPESACF